MSLLPPYGIKQSSLWKHLREYISNFLVIQFVAPGCVEYLPSTAPFLYLIKARISICCSVSVGAQPIDIASDASPSMRPVDLRSEG